MPPITGKTVAVTGCSSKGLGLEVGRGRWRAPGRAARAVARGEARCARCRRAASGAPRPARRHVALTRLPSTRLT